MNEGVEAVIDRKAMDRLVEWKQNRRGAAALLIEGARRVGKSTLAEAFGKRHYRSYLLIDFARIPQEVADIFMNLRTDIDKFFQYLSAFYGVRLYPRESLVIFDEVQTFPIARGFIKYLVADGRYDYIETGSLLSIRQNVQEIVIPSEEESFRLNPLDFEEFLVATGNDSLSDLIREAFERGYAVPDALHRKASRLFREYMLIGGMPRVVDVYAQTSSFEKADEEKRRILDLYRKDVARFAYGYQDKVGSIFDEIPAQLSKHEKRFTLASLGKSARSRTYEEAFFWLADAQISIPCFSSTDPSVGLALSRDSSALKCYMADTGLLATMSLLTSNATKEDLYRGVLFGKLSLNEGMLVENVVAQTLVAKGDRLFYYSQSGKKEGEERLEIDFLVVRPFKDAGGKPRVSPIEVKSSVRFRVLSLERFAEKFREKIGTEYVVYPGPMRRDGRRLLVPLYAAHCL